MKVWGRGPSDQQEKKAEGNRKQSEEKVTGVGHWVHCQQQETETELDHHVEMRLQCV